MLAVRCELLLGSYQASNQFDAAQTVEWPPHPYRLHAALVGAACEAGGREPCGDEVDALRWLEIQEPPAIACSPDPSRRTAATTWVPRNPTRGAEWKRYVEAGSAVNRVGRTFPTAVPEDPTVMFIWRRAKDGPVALRELVTSVAWLGSSRSPVTCAIVPDAPPPTFVPDRDGDHQVRVAARGLTDELLAARFSHPQPVSVPIAGYREANAGGESTTPTAVAGPFSELLVRRAVGATQEAADASLIGSALRLAVLSCAGDSAPPALHGHAPGREHAAYLPLFDVGHPGAPGTLRGVGLALPDDLQKGEREACAEAFSAVGPLVVGEGRRPLPVDDEIADVWTLAPERWIGPAKSWGSVTPIVLDRFPRRGRTPTDELRASIANADLPAADEIELLAAPAVAGGALNGALRGDVPPGLRVHARVRFPTPVRGPVLVGRGRFRGVGLLLPERGR